MSRQKFYAVLRQEVFGGRLQQSQVDGINRIVSYRDEKYPSMSDNQLAYLLATTFWETGRKMTPVREGGGMQYLKSKPYFPYYGRGLCQLTWSRNYARYQCADNPDRALDWDVALHAIFDGMVRGIFTGKKLSDYINANRTDFVNARRIINGTDKAQVIANLAYKWRAALREWIPDPSLTPSAAPPEPAGSKLSRLGSAIKSAVTGSDGAASNAGMPPPVPHVLTGAKAYTFSAIMAAIGALQLIDWEQVVEHPEVGYGLIASAIGGSVFRAVAPVWLQKAVIQ